MVTAVAQAGDLDRAEEIARTITGPNYLRTGPLASLATAVAQAGDLDRAEAIARTITDPHQPGLGARRAWPLRPPRPETWTAPRQSSAPSPTATSRPRRSTSLAIAAAQAGDLDRAEAIVRTITDRHQQALALASLATAVAQADDLARAAPLLAAALVGGVPMTSWIKTMLQFFPSAIEDTWDILSGFTPHELDT